MAKKIKAGIVGGAGYTGGEMCRLLVYHPNVELTFVHSNSNAGNYLWEVHTDLYGDTNMRFTDTLSQDVDVLFLCVGHGDARKFLEATSIDAKIKIIDLSQDFRLAEKSAIGQRHFVYGLPEVNHADIATASNIANPGCFATAIQLGVLPLCSAGLLRDDVHISATTGSTGAGQSLSATSHFSWRHANLSTYKVFTHQHLLEVGETMHRLQPTFSNEVNFVPYRGDFPRGIIASIYTKYDGDLADGLKLYKEFYKDAAFTFVADKTIHLKQVVNTNKAILSLAKHGDKLLITSVIDNLLKGASGQAVQNMNIMFGLEERAGLNLKPLAF